ncbi:MAG TPA: aminotransferase class I/II-fold pyridoxal phosphate-dependent enzyme, partial [Anaerolineales bacterium]|nr:aminotransferase class I/II-fold pyridoxal phosphate-dependent enzyme [Anaerolineales bacterium]
LPSQKLLETVAERMYRLYGWNVSPEMIVPTTGVNIGYNVAARTFCNPHQGYLIQTPVYNEFHETQTKTGMMEIESPLAKKIEGNRIRYEVDFDVFEKAAKKAAIFMLCHPHNPIGHIYSRQELRRMAEVCLENDVIIVSDEIHSELLLGGAIFQPMATLSRQIANHTITLISASKTFNVPGLFCAFAIIPNKKLRERFRETVFRMGIHVASPGQIAARVAYAGKCDTWLRSLRRYLTANRDFLVNEITRYLPEVRLTVPDATYLAWLDFSELKLKPFPYQFFLKEAKVALSDGGKFGKGSEQFVRLNFGTSRKWLEEGLDRMKRALK